MLPILVVGGAGYIGSHISKALFEAGYFPIVYDNLSKGHSWALKWGAFFEGDIRDEARLESAFKTYEPLAVIHLASLIDLRESVSNPLSFYEVNLFGTQCLLKAMLSSKTRYIVFSSTAAIYGAPQGIPIAEDHPKCPMNAYGKTKWAAECMLEDFSKAYGLCFAALRYFNASGADESGEIGEAHDPETHLIPLAIQAAFGKREKLTIFGTDHPTPDGTAVRDYIHVSDLATAHVKALKFLMGHNRSFQANLGTGAGYSVQEIIDAVSQISGKRIPVELAPRRLEESSLLIADCSRAMRLLDWKPVKSDLTTIVSSAINWHLEAVP
jgi:UDP-glucose-4-epimerase GalE